VEIAAPGVRHRQQRWISIAVIGGTMKASPKPSGHKLGAGNSSPR
jgi:hypothetical protein